MRLEVESKDRDIECVRLEVECRDRDCFVRLEVQSRGNLLSLEIETASNNAALGCGARVGA